MRRARIALAATLAFPVAAVPLLPLPFPLPAAIAASTADDMGFLTRLALMEGHLQIGHELLQAKRQPLALPHFGHPVRELYDDIAPELKKRGIPPFEAELLKLETMATSAPETAATAAQFQVVFSTIARARDSVDASLRASVPQMVRVCANVLDVAAGEYGEAVERGRIRNVVEYHDSRGFVLWVAAELRRLQNATPTDPALLARFRPAMEAMRGVVAPLMPPGTPPVSVADYRAMAQKAVEAAGQ